MAQRGRPRKYPRIEAHFEAERTPDTVKIREDAPAVYACGDLVTEILVEPVGPQIPADWHPGMLLNVRNTGADYTITLFPEEADPRQPERALHFRNPAECQNFVSAWYSRQSHDPRAG